MIHKRARRQEIIYQDKKEYFWILGDDKKPAMLILEGFTSTHSDFLLLAQKLKNDFFIIIPDLPGWGISQKLYQDTIENYAIFLQAVLIKLRISKVQIVAHCTGSAIALLYALKFPKQVSDIFLISIPFEEGTLNRQFFLHLVKLSEKSPKIIRPIFYFWRSRFIDLPIIFFMMRYRSWHKKFRTLNYDLWIQSFQDEDTVEQNWDSFLKFNFESAKEIKVPIHLIHGDEDIIISKNQAVKFSKLLKKATLDIIPNVGHLPPTESPGTVASLILKYNT